MNKSKDMVTQEEIHNLNMLLTSENLEDFLLVMNKILKRERVSVIPEIIGLDTLDPDEISLAFLMAALKAVGCELKVIKKN